MIRQRVRYTSLRTVVAASVLAMTATLAPVPMDAAHAADVEQLLEEARTFRAEGRVADSIIQIKNALQQEPANAEANALLGDIYLGAGDVQRGRLQLERARDLGGAPDLWMLPLMRAWLASDEAARVMELTEDLPESLDPVLRADALALRGRAQAAAGDAEAAHETMTRAMELAPKAALPPAGLARLEASAGNVQAATELAEQALANAPNDPDVLYIAGDLALTRGETAKALEHYRAIKDMRPINPFVRVPLAQALIAAGQMDAAADELDWVLEKVPEYPQAVYLRGHVAYVQGQMSEADSLLARGLASDPANQRMQLLAGLVKYRLGQHEQAVRLLSGLAEGAGALPQARIALGASLLETGRHDRAYRVLTPLPDDMKQNADALALAGQAARLAGKAEESLDLLSAASELRPDDAAILRQLAATHSALGQGEEGLETLGLAVEKDTSNDRAVSTYFAMLMQKNLPDQALAVADKVVTDRPEAGRGHTMRGLALLAGQDPEGAEAAFRKAISLDPGAADAAGNLAALLRQQDRVDEAEAVLLSAHEAAPRSSALMLRLADIAALRGDKAEARSWLEQAVEAGTVSPRPRARLAALLLEEGRPDAALATAVPGLNTFPRDPELLEMVARARLATGDAANGLAAARTLAEVKSDAETLKLLVNAARQAGNQSVLADALERYTVVEPDNLEVRLALAALELGDNDAAGAREHMDAALALAPDDVRVIQMETRTRLARDPRDGVAYLRDKIAAMEAPPGDLVHLLASAERPIEPEQAVARLSDWSTANPDDTRARLILSMWHIEDGRFQAAEPLLESLVADDPESWVNHNNLAYVLMRQGRLDAALDHIDKARLHGGNQPELLDTEGQIRLRMNDLVMAEQLFRQAASQTARPGHRLNLAEALVALDRRDDARQVLEQVQGARTTDAERERTRDLLARLEGGPEEAQAQ
ncbi:XrtA/PEP-CTERM system TPR-repeat protein PrsT [Caenispirillum salinarum]|uniref:XrtA/PEP-CTERM system TPR-repeat protein PrsT n=1 Tax=Caenispirillum salinarum TaxID=859058 RepID=UPI0009FDC967|nr:XrtA/PEP-CTERM system TPR-repeat protein PrsT [Caenispirillum salinarum]